MDKKTNVLIFESHMEKHLKLETLTWCDTLLNGDHNWATYFYLH